MKVFISWSGDTSLKLAQALRVWLPDVLHSAHPFVSNEDIEKGSKWDTSLEEALAESPFGIICLTQSNLSSPWVHYEAGALSRSFEDARISSVLYNVKHGDIKGPLTTWQNTLCTRDDIFRLIASVNSHSPEDERLDDERLRRSFDKWWPELEGSIEKLGDGEAKPEGNAEGVLDELLALGRNQAQALKELSSQLDQQPSSRNPSTSLGVLREISGRLDALVDHLEERVTFVESVVEPMAQRVEAKEIIKWEDAEEIFRSIYQIIQEIKNANRALAARVSMLHSY